MTNLKGLNVGITLKDNIHSKKDNMWSEKESLGYFGCYNIRENKKISFSSYRIKDKRLMKNAKIVMISDLHNACYGEKNSELLHVVETISPDLILVAGDVIVGKTGLSVDTGVDFLNSLGESFPVFVGKGNHEMRTSIYEKYGDMWETLYERTKDKVHWLINDSI